MDFSALLWKRWESAKARDPSGEIDVIRGFWAEDGSSFYVQAPMQLIPLILTLQNRLSDVYNEVAWLEGRAAQARELFSKIISK